MNERIKIATLAIVFLAIGAITALTITQVTSSRYSAGDLNHDGVVDSLDLSVVLNNWTK